MSSRRDHAGLRLNAAGLMLVVTLPWTSIVAGAAMFAIGLAGRALVHG